MKTQFIALVLLTSFAVAAQAETMLQILTDEKYAGPSVEDQIALMDTDKNGFADVFELRAYMQKLHGEDFEKDLLDKLVASAQGKSCSTPFAKSLYGDNSGR